MPPRHRFLEPIHNVKERGEPLTSAWAYPCEDLVFIPGKEVGGASRDRTGDLKLAKLALSQLSYGPEGTAHRNSGDPGFQTPGPSQRMMWWAWEDLNFRPHAYQARALTN